MKTLEDFMQPGQTRDKSPAKNTNVPRVNPTIFSGITSHTESPIKKSSRDVEATKKEMHEVAKIRL